MVPVLGAWYLKANIKGFWHPGASAMAPIDMIKVEPKIYDRNKGKIQMVCICAFNLHTKQV